MSFVALDNLLTLGLVAMTLSLLTKARWQQFIVMVAALSSMSSLYALWQTLHTGIHLNCRASGVFSHYMTFAGWTMTVVLILAGELIHGNRRQRIWIVPVVVLHTLVLALSLTRNAWLGLASGLGLAVILWRPRPALALPLVAVIAAAILPAEVRERVSSIADLEQHANQDRIAMVGAGMAMIADHPWVGVGPEMVAESYPTYRKETAVRERPSHLHCNPIHIAAECGLPALGAWLATLVVFGWTVRRALRDPAYPAPAAAASALLAVVGLTMAGLFEYNWGDSEIWILTLFLLAVPSSLEGE